MSINICSEKEIMSGLSSPPLEIMRREKVDCSKKSISQHDQHLVRRPLALRSGPRGTERRRPTTQNLVLLHNIPRVKTKLYFIILLVEAALSDRQIHSEPVVASDDREIGLYRRHLLWFHKATITNTTGRYQQFIWVRLSS
jgi:hypothetical protein